MILTNKHYITSVLLILFFCQNVFGQLNAKLPKATKSSIADLLSPIGICNWKDDARSCLNVSFDDNCKTHNQISRIFDKYGYKATFYVISSFMFVDSLKDMSARGHEIGNHTYSHAIPFTQLDSTAIDFQIRKSQEEIENAFGIKCVSFAEPWHNATSQSRDQVFNYELFSRDYSKYNIYSRLDINETTTITKVSSYINTGISSGSMLIIDGHGIDGDGPGPVTKNMLVQLLDTVKQHVDSKELWITTLKDAQQYENLVHEVSLDKTLNNDTLTIQFRNYDADKYQDVDSSRISIKIPKSISSTISCLTNSAIVKELKDEFVLTMDLKTDTTMVVILSNLVKSSVVTPTDSISEDNRLIIYPNPANDKLFIKNSEGIFSTEIYDLQGNLLLKQVKDDSQIDVSTLPNGYYIIKVIEKQADSTLVVRNKFLKM